MHIHFRHQVLRYTKQKIAQMPTTAFIVLDLFVGTNIFNF